MHRTPKQIGHKRSSWTFETKLIESMHILDEKKSFLMFKS